MYELSIKILMFNFFFFTAINLFAQDNIAISKCNSFIEAINNEISIDSLIHYFDEKLRTKLLNKKLCNILDIYCEMNYDLYITQIRGAPMMYNIFIYNSNLNISYGDVRLLFNNKYLIVKWEHFEDMN